MPIRVSCTVCGKQGAVPERFAGQKVKCSCGAALLVPAAGGPASKGPDTKPVPLPAKPQAAPGSPAATAALATTSPAAGGAAVKAPAPGEPEVFALKDDLAPLLPAPVEPVPLKPTPVEPPAVALPTAAKAAATKTALPAAKPAAPAAAKPKAPKPPALANVFAREDPAAVAAAQHTPALAEEAEAAEVVDDAEVVEESEPAKPAKSRKRKRDADDDEENTKSTVAIVLAAVVGGILVVGLVFLLVSGLGARNKGRPPVQGEQPMAAIETAPVVDKTEPTPPPSTAPAVPAGPNFKKAFPAIVRIEARGAKAIDAPGFFLTADGIVVASLRAVQEAATATVIMGDGTRHPVEGIVAVDRSTELALLKVSGASFPTLPLAEEKLPEAGAKIYALGPPHEVKEGTIKELKEVSESLTVLHTTVTVAPGTALVSADGKVVGVTTGAISDDDKAEAAAPASRLAKLLSTRGNSRPLPGPEGATQLRWDLKAGDVFYVERTVNSTSRYKLKGKEDNRGESSESQLLRFQVTRADDKDVVLEERIERNKFKTNRSSRMPGIMGKTVGATFVITLNRRHELVKIEGLQELTDKLLGGADLKLRAEFERREFSREMRSLAGVLFAFCPTPPLWKGDTWKASSQHYYPGFGELLSIEEHTYEGPTEEGERISFRSRIQYRPPIILDENDPIQIRSGELKVEADKGTIVFNPRTRRLVQIASSARMRGQFNGRFYGRDSTMDVTSDTTAVLRVLDKPPDAAGGP